MANTLLKTNRSPIISLEQQTSVFGSSATLSSAGFTVPAGAHELHCYPSDACYVNHKGTASSTNGSHRIAANQMFIIPHAKQTDVEIIADSAMTLTIAYMK